MRFYKYHRQTTIKHFQQVNESKIFYCKLIEMRFIIFLVIGLYCGSEKSLEIIADEILYPPPLVYPFGGTIKLVAGIAAPIPLGGRTLVYSQNFQFQYALPQNATFFTNYFTSLTRRRRSLPVYDERQIFYQLLEAELLRWSGDGKSCMLRSICEASEISLNREGLIEELFYVILTPNYGNNSTFVDEDYLQAAQAGRSGDDCSIIYSGCPKGVGLLDRITQIRSYDID